MYQFNILLWYDYFKLIINKELSYSYKHKLFLSVNENVQHIDDLCFVY